MSLALEQDAPQSGYKQTELGLIPEDWEVVFLGNVGETFIGLTYSPNEVQSDGTLVLRSSNVQNGRLCFGDNVFVKTEVPDRATVREGDILICVRNGSRDLIGKSAVIDASSAGMAFGAFMGLYRSPFNQFISHAFQSDIIKRQISEHLGATINQITNKSLNGFCVPIPTNTREQKAIAEALSDADGLIEALSELIAKKRQIKQGAMQELLTGKKRLAGFEGVNDYQQTELGSLPCDWNVINAGSFGKFRGGNGFPLHYQGEQHGIYPYFKVSDMNNDGNEVFMKSANNYISELSRKKLGAFIFPKDTIVFAKVGAAIFLERKKLLEKPSCLDNNMAGFTIFDENMDIRFVYHQLLEVKLGNLVSATALPSLNGDVLRGIKLAVPSKLSEQFAIVEVLDSMDAEISMLETKLEKAKQIKQGMMQDLLSGKVRLI